jgi:hypothetical protein
MMPGVRMKQLFGDANASARFEPFSVAGIDELHARDRILRLIDFILTAGHAERPTEHYNQVVLARVFLRRLAIAGRAERDALARRPSRLVTAGS